MTKEEFISLVNKISKDNPFYASFGDNAFLLNNLDNIEPNENGSALLFRYDPERIFGISDDLFQEKKRESASGGGQNDLRNLKSSSLSPLLCFYNIRKDPLHILIDGEGFTFWDSHFEVKNKCVGSGNSFMDVVLYGSRDHDNKKVIFHLETKFSEYFRLGSRNGISTDYEPLYSNEYKRVLDACGLKCSPAQIRKDGNTINVIKLESNDSNGHYCEGVKQMICHHIAVGRFIKGDTHEEALQQACESLGVPFDQLQEVEVYLGEVLYEFEGHSYVTKGRGHKKHDINVFEDYCSLYKRLVGAIKVVNPKIHMIPRVLTYQEVFENGGIENHNIIEFYNLK